MVNKSSVFKLLRFNCIYPSGCSLLFFFFFVIVMDIEWIEVTSCSCMLCVHVNFTDLVVRFSAQSLITIITLSIGTDRPLLTV